MTYKSKFAPLGIPFVHIATAKMEDGLYKRGIARGWIAIGDISFGILFSFGGIAIGGISFGGLSVGLLLSIGGLSLGGLALGGCAIGCLAAGGCAIAWHAAMGGCAIAHNFAIGGCAIAENANNDAARQFFLEDMIFNIANSLMQHAKWLILLVFIPVIAQISNKLKPKASGFEYKAGKDDSLPKP